MEYSYVAIGEKIRQRRKELAISQETLSRNVKIDRNTLSSLENGNNTEKMRLSLPQLCKLASELNCDIPYLLGDREDFTTITDERIGKVTGLSGKAVEKIRSLPVRYQCVLNQLIESKDFERLLWAVGDYIDTDMTVEKVSIASGATYRTKFNDRTIKKFLGENARMYFERILDKLR